MNQISFGKDPRKFIKEITGDCSSEWNAIVHKICKNINQQKWDACSHDVLTFIGTLNEDDYEFAAKNHQVLDLMERYEQDRVSSMKSQSCIAYFSLEFGISKSMHQYAGGLGILAGDHLKSASDLSLQLIAVGLLYKEGSPHQFIDESGLQHDYWNPLPNDLPMELIRDAKGEPLLIPVDFPEGCVYVQLHELRIGEIRMILLDTFHEQNADLPMLQSITDRLYSGGREHRLRQEYLIGIGGMKALHAIGMDISFLHVNEGHCAFAITAWLQKKMQELQKPFHEIKNLYSSSILFTTHTPVSAGNEVFTNELILKVVEHHRIELGLNTEEFLEMGSVNDADTTFSMSAMALKLSGVSNAVSKMHEQTARSMWNSLVDGKRKPGSRIISITNGIHTTSWIGPAIRDLLDEHIGSAWRMKPYDIESWNGLLHIPDDEFSAARKKQKESLIRYIAEHRTLHRQPLREKIPQEVLLIGYARRFASYKRAHMLFSDMDRLHSLLMTSSAPVHVIIAGKAHPDDWEAKEIIRTLHQTISEHQLQSSITLLEDYDIALATFMVQGCDLWLNTPRRPMEASGTSGMKAAVNGCLHCSILDGWWDEAYNPTLGFAIPTAMNTRNDHEQDMIEAQYLFDVLEQEVLPVFAGTIERHAHSWTELMKKSIMDLAPRFSSARMVKEYRDRIYAPNTPHS